MNHLLLWLTGALAAISGAFTALYMKKKISTTPTPKPPPEAKILPSERIYDAAKRFLGQHIAAEPGVPEEVGCATAVVYVLEEAGFIPPPTIVGVNALIDWLLANGFVETTSGSPGDIITAHSADHANPNFAHTGIVLQYGIASNDSSNGRFAENYSMDSWLRYFSIHNSHTRYFHAV